MNKNYNKLNKYNFKDKRKKIKEISIIWSIEKIKLFKDFLLWDLNLKEKFKRIKIKIRIKIKSLNHRKNRWI